MQLDSNLIRSIPPGFFSLSVRLSTLWLSNNLLSSISQADFPASLHSNLEQLWLHGNNLTSLAPETFANLANLKGLFLYQNPIASVSPGALAGLASLSALYLSQSEIAIFPPDFFAPVGESLVALYVFDCRLKSVPQNLPVSLMLLALHQNEIAEILPGDFSDLKNLTTLSLHVNAFTKLPGDFLFENRKLTTVSMCSNVLERGHPRLDFSRLENLAEIYLCFMGLEMWPIFPMKLRLQLLVINNNRIGGDCEYCLPELTVLSVQENKITGFRGDQGCLASLSIFLYLKKY